MAGRKKDPWKGRCSALRKDNTTCNSATPRNWETCLFHTNALARELDTILDDVEIRITAPGLGKKLVEMTEADWMACRVRAVASNPDLFIPRLERDFLEDD